MNAKQRRAHIRELTALYKDTVPSEFNAELVSELIDAGKDIKHKDIKIEALRAENEALKQQVEQVKRDALLHAAKVIGLYDDATMQNDYMLDSCDCAEILIALAAAQKQDSR